MKGLFMDIVDVLYLLLGLLVGLIVGLWSGARAIVSTLKKAITESMKVRGENAEK